MKFVALLVVMAIIGILVVKRAQPSQIAEAVNEFDATVQPAGSLTPTPLPGAITPAPSTTGLRAPLDRTRSVLDQVKQRNGKDEF